MHSSIMSQLMCCCLALSNDGRKGTTLSANDILSLNACDLSDAIHDGTVSSADVMAATLDRIEQVNPSANAIISLRSRQALIQEAQTADAEFSKRRRDSSAGWMHGIPIAIKDLSNASLIPTTLGGSALLPDFTPYFADPFVQNLQKHGAIVIGKTNVPECGLGSHTYNDRWGTTVNPFDVTKSSGGSSGGAAVALTTRMLCIADGSDMMGSLRNPAGWNLLYSHRPTAGIVPQPKVRNAQANPLPYPISTPGPMARTPMDLAQLLRCMIDDDATFGTADIQRIQHIGGSSIDDNNSNSNNNRINDNAEQRETDAPQSKLRIGWIGDWGGSYPTEDGILDICSHALEEFANRYPDQISLIRHDSNDTIFSPEKLWQSWNIARASVVASGYIPVFGEEKLFGENAKIKPDFQWELRQGQKVTDEDLADAKQIAQEYQDTMDATVWSSQYDVLAMPSAQVWPFPAEWKWPQRIGTQEMDTYHRWMEMEVPVSLGGFPCVTVPAGLRADEPRLPMGIQLFSARGEDVRLLRLAQMYHEYKDWPSRVDAFHSTGGNGDGSAVSTKTLVTMKDPSSPAQDLKQEQDKEQE